MNIYDYQVKDHLGIDVSLSDYKNQVILIFNSATRCGFTPQYDELQDLYEKYQEEGFIILDFPCNQFANQAPGSEEEIHSFCEAKFGITFPMMSKVEVNGEHTEPLFTYLKQQQGYQGMDKGHPLFSLLSGAMSKAKNGQKDDIRWNFTKFLVDRDGNVVARYEPTADMEEIENKIQELL